MVKTKRKGILRTLLCAVFALCFAVGLSSLFANGTTAYAAESETSHTVLFNYVHKYQQMTSVATDGQGTGVSSCKVMTGRYSSATVTVSMTAIADSGNFPSGGYVRGGSVSITVSGWNCNVSIVNSSGKSVASGSKGSVSASGLSDGSYTVNMSFMGAGWNPNPRSYANYSMTADFSFVIDRSTPTISGASTSSTGKYTNSSTYVSASDSVSGVNALYVKNPNNSYYSSAGTSTTIASTGTNGLYCFYAKDKAGNTSATYYLYLDTVKPTGTIKNSNGTEITGSYTNQTFSYSATDSGSGISYLQYKKPGSSSWLSYTSGTTISSTATNGQYQFRAVDKAGNESETVMICLDTVKPTGTLYGGTSTVASGGKTNANYVKFVPSDSMSGIKSIYVQTPSSSGYESYTSGSQLAEEGTYSFYCTDAAGNCSMIYTVILDKSAPILGCLQTEFYSTYGLGFTVSASDDSGSVKLYYKTPSSSSYVLAGTSSYSTTLESENGKYYFYAVDDLGNRSQTYWIELEIVYPDPTIEQSGTDNSVCITWTNGNKATLNGDDYTKGTWIKTEGSYTVTVTNEYGLSTTKTFSITHNYVVTKIVEPTCTTKGYSVFKCTSCGDEYEGNVKLAFGHNYDVETIEATCTTYGCIKHTCLNCGDTYETDVRTALGHKYTETTKEATCTEDGGQLHTCTVCGYEYLTDTVKATGHDYATRVVREPHCETAGERIFHCEKCGDEYYTEIPATGHNFELAESSVVDGENIRTYVCTNCGAVTTQNMGEQYEKVSSYVEYLFEQYQPYMWWVLLATAGVWSVVMGVFFGIAAKNEDKEKARKMIKNYVIGLVVIAVILVACPYLVRGIAALIAG